MVGAERVFATGYINAINSLELATNPVGEDLPTPGQSLWTHIFKKTVRYIKTDTKTLDHLLTIY